MTNGEVFRWARDVCAPETAAAEPAVDVVVPVYGSVDVTLHCLRSVIESDNETPCELIVIDDASPPSEPGVSILDEMANRGVFTLLRNSENLGFPATCNRGFALHPDRDVVLLNSDTEVFGDWLDRLTRVALGSDRVATVTPLTNDGEITSYPKFCEANPLPADITPDVLDQLTSRINRSTTVETPTGVGFCMYVRRACLEEVGPFDAAAFGKGYGEENDLCQRAAERGWTNVITADTFVLHRGGGSFGPSKQRRIREALSLLDRRHPGYGGEVAAFIDEDPLSAARQALDLARIERVADGPRFLMVTHDWGGGVEKHVQDMKQLLEEQGASIFLCRPGPDNEDVVRVEGPFDLITPNLPELRISHDPSKFAALLKKLKIDHVHVHNVAGYEPSMSRYLVEALQESDTSYDVTLHDYQSFCPQIHLIGISQYYCGEPNEEACARCVNSLGSSFGKPPIWLWRQTSADLLRGARKVFAPSRDTADRVARHFAGLRPVVRRHPEVTSRPSASQVRPKVSPRPHGFRRVGLLGAVGTAKGSHVLMDVAQLAAKGNVPLQFVVLGTTDIDDLLSDFRNVEITGSYDDGDLEQMIEAAGLDLLWFPAVWPETYSYTLSSALRTRLQIVAFDFGAIAERLREQGRGHLLPVESMLDPAGVLDALEEAATTPLLVEEATAGIPDDTSAHLLRDYYGLPRSAMGGPKVTASRTSDPTEKKPRHFGGPSL